MLVGLRHRVVAGVAVGALVVGMAGCSALAARLEVPTAAAPTISAPTTLEASPPPSGASTVPTSVAAAAPAAEFRRLAATGFGPLATVDDVTLHHPAALVELVGLHESGHDGARALTPVAGPIQTIVLTTRHRGTAATTAADIVVARGSEIRAPVTGTVLRAGEYVLYCSYTDEFVVIEPDGHPGWEVRIFHVDGVLLAPGQRVEAASTRLAAQAASLPFASQVDESTSAPHLPHVHIELVDTAVPDRPTAGMDC